MVTNATEPRSAGAEVATITGVSKTNAPATSAEAITAGAIAGGGETWSPEVPVSTDVESTTSSQPGNAVPQAIPGSADASAPNAAEEAAVRLDLLLDCVRQWDKARLLAAGVGDADVGGIVHVLGTILSSAADVFNRPIRALSAMNLLLPYTEMPGIGELQESLARLVKGTAKKSSKAGSSAEPRSPEDQAARKAAADEAMAVLKEMTLPHRAKRKPATKAAEGKAPAVPAPDVDLLDPQTIVVDPSVQPREKLDEAVVDEYAEAMLSGATFPLVTVFRDPADGGLILADGFHRHAAAIRAGQARIRARIYVGTRREAVMHAAGANAKHGLRRTNADKRRAVMMLLNDDEWAQFPDREIGRRCGVTHPFVANVREDLARGNDYHADAAGGDHGTPGTSTAAGGTDGALGADETVGAEDAAAADDAEASPAQASVDQGGIEPTEGTSTVPAGPANAAPSPEADATTASTGLDAMIPTDMADDRGPGVGTDAPSASELIGLVIGRLQQDHEAYPIDIVAAIRDELGKGYPGFLATVQALFDAALVQLQAQIDAAARAEAQAQAASQVPAQPPAPVVAQVTLDL